MIEERQATAAEVLAGAAMWAVVHGDALDVLRGMPDASVDAVVTDPPAGIGFMAKTWDKPGTLGVSGGVAMPATTSSRNPSCRTCGGRKRAGAATKACTCEEPDWNEVEHRLRDRAAFIAGLTAILREALRVLKPGGHALVWGLPRTTHWTATAVEDAGFEIRDSLRHVFGQGFPKSLNVSKAIDEAAGAERPVIGSQTLTGRAAQSCAEKGGTYTAGAPASDGCVKTIDLTAPATPEAEQWDGWGTALRPLSEDWILARKPLIGTVAENVLAHGTGAINVDACRVGTAADVPSVHGVRASDEGEMRYGSGLRRQGDVVAYEPTGGRWPPNLLLTHAPGCRVVGTRKVPTGTAVNRNRDPGTMTAWYGTRASQTGDDVGYADADGTEKVPAYDCAPGCPVAAVDEQSGTLHTHAGTMTTEHAAMGYGGGKESSRVIEGDSGGASRFYPTFEPEVGPGFLYQAKASTRERNAGLPPRGNKHPTVKPIKLMRWLVRLITPPGGVVLDMFNGSGTTGIGAVLEGARYIGIEKDEDSAATARARIAYWQANPPAPPKPKRTPKPKAARAAAALDPAPPPPPSHASVATNRGEVVPAEPPAPPRSRPPRAPRRPPPPPCPTSQLGLFGATP